MTNEGSHAAALWAAATASCAAFIAGAAVSAIKAIASFAASAALTICCNCPSTDFRTSRGLVPGLDDQHQVVCVQRRHSAPSLLKRLTYPPRVFGNGGACPCLRSVLRDISSPSASRISRRLQVRVKNTEHFTDYSRTHRPSRESGSGVRGLSGTVRGARKNSAENGPELGQVRSTSGPHSSARKLLLVPGSLAESCGKRLGQFARPIAAFTDSVSCLEFISLDTSVPRRSTPPRLVGEDRPIFNSPSPFASLYMPAVRTSRLPASRCKHQPRRQRRCLHTPHPPNTGPRNSLPTPMSFNTCLPRLRPAGPAPARTRFNPTMRRRIPVPLLFVK